MRDADVLAMAAMLERVADLESRLTGLYAAIGATAVISMLPVIAGAIGRIFS